MAIITLRPTGLNGGYTNQLTGSSGTTRYDLIDEDTPDDSDYVYSAANTSSVLSDFYDFDDSSNLGTINSATLYARCRYVNIGAGDPGYIAAVALAFLNPTHTGSWQNLTTSWALYSAALSSPTWAIINSTIYQLSTQNYAANSKNYEQVQCSQLYLVVDYTPKPSTVGVKKSTAEALRSAGCI